MNIIFAGTPEIAGSVLSGLISSGLKITHVYTQPDRPAGRGRQLMASAVKTVALDAGIPVLQPTTFKTADQIHLLEKLAPDLIIVVAYGMILPPAVLAIPRYGCINVHFSLLPRWRGASPVQQAILAGDEHTGVAIMQLDAGLDTGPVLKTARYKILPHQTTEDLFHELTLLATPLLLSVIQDLQQSHAVPVAQDTKLATHAPLIEKSEARIDWNKSVLEIDRKIRAFYPWPVAYTQLGDQALRIFKAHIIDEHTQETPGLLLTATADGLNIATGLGILRITEVQLPGKRRVLVSDLLNAHHEQLRPGMVFL